MACHKNVSKPPSHLATEAALKWIFDYMANRISIAYLKGYENVLVILSLRVLILFTPA